MNNVHEVSQGDVGSERTSSGRVVKGDPASLYAVLLCGPEMLRDEWARGRLPRISEISETLTSMFRRYKMAGAIPRSEAATTLAATLVDHREHSGAVRAYVQGVTHEVPLVQREMPI